jgi:hypothetical protein
MRRIAVVVGGVGVVAVALAVVLALGLFQQGSSGRAPARPLTATAALGTYALSFGDPLSARIEVLVDPRKVDVGSVRVHPRFAPWRIVSSSTDRHSAAGTLLGYRYTLECLSPACLPGRTLAERRFLPAFVSYRTAAGRPARRLVDWPTYRVATRLTSPDIGDPTERLAADVSLPPVSYRIAPGTLQALLAALSALLVIAAGTLVYFALPKRRAAKKDLPPIERALRLVRASTANGYPAERRMALGGLARELSADGRRDLAQAAVRLAWSSQPPSSEAASAFADRVEESL